MSLRTTFAAIVACLALAVVAVPGASASPASPQRTTVSPLYSIPVNSSSSAPMHGIAKNGKQFNGRFDIYQFVAKNGKVWAKGTMVGTLKGRHVKRGNVMFPVQSLNNDSSSGQAQTAQQGCPVLHLVLGPINLNLLGLQVQLGGGPQANQVITLDITAHQGQGLLGDLLCGLTNALSGTGILSQLSGQLQQLAGTLNALVGLFGAL